MDEETEVEEDNIDPLVAPPLLARPTPSLHYPPSLRLRFPTYAHTYDLSKPRETVLAMHARVAPRVVARSNDELFEKREKEERDGPPLRPRRSFGPRSSPPRVSTRPSAATLVSLPLRVFVRR